MNILFTKGDFDNLNKIEKLNQQFFSLTHDYKPKSKRIEAKLTQKPVWNKMRGLKDSLLEQSYFNKRFDIIESKPNKRSTQTVKGFIRRIIWISLVDKNELYINRSNNLKHFHLPQLQISLRPDELIVASIWLEAIYCKQVYKEKLLNFLKKNGLVEKYKLVVYDKNGDIKVFDNYYKRLSSKDFLRFKNGRNYSLGINRTFRAQEVVKLKESIFSLIISELQELNEKILAPCYNFRIRKIEKGEQGITKASRRPSEKFDIKNSLRKGIEPTVITKKHQKVQNALYNIFLKQYSNLKCVTKLEEDFVDIRIENSVNKSMILYEIKTDKTAMNCIKHGLGQLLFYNLMNKNLGWEKIELVIVGLHKLKPQEKEFIRGIKEYLGKDYFRYQRFDETKKILLNEKRS